MRRMTRRATGEEPRSLLERCLRARGAGHKRPTRTLICNASSRRARVYSYPFRRHLRALSGGDGLSSSEYAYFVCVISQGPPRGFPERARASRLSGLSGLSDLSDLCFSRLVSGVARLASRVSRRASRVSSPSHLSAGSTASACTSTLYDCSLSTVWWVMRTGRSSSPMACAAKNCSHALWHASTVRISLR